MQAKREEAGDKVQSSKDGWLWWRDLNIPFLPVVTPTNESLVIHDIHELL